MVYYGNTKFYFSTRIYPVEYYLIQKNCGTVRPRFVTLTLISEIFEDMVISGGLWQSRSSDFFSLRFLIMGKYKKESIQRQSAHSLWVSRQYSIVREIGRIAVDVTALVYTNFFGDLRIVLQQRDVIFRTFSTRD